MMKLILSELKKISRDVRPMIMMLVIPILLTITLGTSLKNLFETSIETKENLVLYHIQDQGAYHIQFQNLVSSLKDEGFIFISTNTFEEGLNAVKNGKYNCFVYISSNYSAVEIYENNKEPLKVSFVEEMLRKFLYPLYIGSSWISKGEKSNAPSDLVELVKMPLPKKPSSIDYYSVTMLTMIILYSAATMIFSYSKEKNSKTLYRIFFSPVSRKKLFFAKYFSALIITMMQIVLIISFDMYVMKAFWSEHLNAVFLVLGTYMLMSLSMGSLMFMIFKKESSMWITINIICQASALLSGSYKQINYDYIPFLGQIASWLPQSAVNNALFEIIYKDSYTMLPRAVAVNLILAAIMYWLSAKLFSSKRVIL